MQKITFKKGIHRINFPTLGLNATEEMDKIKSQYDLPKYREIGFSVFEYRHPITKKWVLSTPEVYITK